MALRRFFFILLVLVAGCQPTDPDQGAALQRQQHSSTGTYAAALSADGRHALVSTVAHGVAVWDTRRNALLYQWSHGDKKNNPIIALAISADGRHAVTAERQRFALWRLADGANLGFWQVRESTIRDIAVANGGRYILIGKNNGVVVHVDLKTGRRLEFLGHTEKVNTVDLSPNGRYALSGGNDYMAYLWDTQSGQIVRRFVHASRVTQVKLKPDGRYAFTADSKKGAFVWSLADGRQISQLQFISRQMIFTAVRFSDDGRYLLTGSPARLLRLWDLNTGQALQQWQVAPRPGSRPQSAVVYAVAFYGNNTVVSESSSGFFEQWQITRQ